MKHILLAVDNQCFLLVYYFANTEANDNFLQKMLLTTKKRNCLAADMIN